MKRKGKGKNEGRYRRGRRIERKGIRRGKRNGEEGGKGEGNPSQNFRPSCADFEVTVYRKTSVFSEIDWQRNDR